MKRLVIAVLAIGLAACGSDSTEPSVSLTGTYDLRTVNGSGLPFTFSDGSTVVSERLTFFGDGTYSDDAQYSDGTVTVENGYFDARNGSISLTNQATGATYNASLSGSVVTEIFSNLTETFQKE